MANKISFNTVRKIGLALPEVEESTSYGAPSLKVRGKLMACPAINKSAERDSIVVCMDFNSRDELLQEDPATYYVTDHYVNFPCVLARLSSIRPDVLPGLLRMAHRYVLSKTPPKKRAGRAAKAVRRP